MNQGRNTLSEIDKDLERGDRSRLEFRLAQVNSAFDLVVLVDEALEILREYSPLTPSFSEDKPQYLISSWFLADCLSYLTGNSQGHERLHLVTGIKISQNQRTLERMVKVALKLASETGALADQHALQKALIEMDRRGHALYGLFEYGETRRKAMCRWTMEVLTNLHLQNWSDLFHYTSVECSQLYSTPIFSEPVWYRPDSPIPVPIFTS